MFVTINISLVCVVAAMHVSTRITGVAVLLTFASLTSQAPEEKLDAVLAPPNEDADTSKVQKNCVTGFGIAGGCVERRYCDYGTPAIDFTSYAPRGYRKTCSDEEVCCPFTAQLPHELEMNINDTTSFDFDDDD